MAGNEEPAAEVGEFEADWLGDESDASDLFDEEEDAEEIDYFAPASAEDEPDWLAGVGEPDEDLEEQEAPAWLDDAEPFDDEDDFVEEPESEFFDDEDIFAEEESEDEPFGIEEVAAAGAVGLGAAALVSSVADDEPEPEQELEPAMQADPEPSVPAWLTFDPDDELLREDEPTEDAEDYELAAIDAAPEWLNAMVPGLDMDFSTEADEPIETAFVDSEGNHRTRATSDEISGNPTRTFKWLMDIVDEEADSVVAPARRRPPLRVHPPPSVAVAS